MLLRRKIQTKGAGLGLLFPEEARVDWDMFPRRRSTYSGWKGDIRFIISYQTNVERTVGTVEAGLWNTSTSAFSPPPPPKQDLTDGGGKGMEILKSSLDDCKLMLYASWPLPRASALKFFFTVPDLELLELLLPVGFVEEHAGQPLFQLKSEVSVLASEKRRRR